MKNQNHTGQTLYEQNGTEVILVFDGIRVGADYIRRKHESKKGTL
jgi:hypothetical protein